MKNAALLLAVVVVMGTWAGSASAMELQVSVSSFSTKPDNSDLESSSGVFPAIAIGGEFGQDMLVFLEFGAATYSVEFLGETDEFLLTSGSVLIVPRFKQVDLRLGYGVVQESFDAKTGPGLTAYLQALGIIDPSIEVDDASGTQYIVGLDVHLGEYLLLGLEYRNANLSHDLRVLDGSQVTITDTIDTSYTWTALRAALSF